MHLTRTLAILLCGFYSSAVSQTFVVVNEQTELDGKLMMASIAADVSVFRGKNSTFGALPPAADTMVNDIALKEGYLELLANMLKVNTQLTYEIDETMGMVQARNDILHGRMEDSRASTRTARGNGR